MIFGFLILAFLYPPLKQMAPDPQTQSFLLLIIVVALIALSLLTIAAKEAKMLIV